MATDIKYVVEKKDDGSWKGFAALKADLETFATGRWMISIKKYRKSRSKRQNAFYWGNFMQSQIDCFKERWGYSYDKVEIHTWNKSMFWAEEHVDEETGEVVRLPASSTEYSTTEWEEKMDLIRTWFMDTFDWPLPFPEQQTEIEY